MIANLGARLLLGAGVAAALAAAGLAGRAGPRLRPPAARALGRKRRRVALRNVELCLPQLPLRRARGLVLQHFEWLGRSLLERGVLWYASAARLKRLIHIEGDVHLAERSRAA